MEMGIFLLIFAYIFKYINSTACYLTDKEPENPFPSLKKCYKFNENSCCTINHDQFIQEIADNLIGENCARNYKEFEDLLCMTCDPNSGNFISVNGTKSVVRICRSLADAIWKADIYNSSTAFDNCGLKVVDEYEQLIDPNIKKHGLIFSSSFTEGGFLSFLKSIPIPYINTENPDFEIEIVEDGNNCYSKGNFLLFSYLFTCILLILL